MSVPLNVIFPYQGAHASIPSGWTRETTLDGLYPKAWGDEDPDETGGASTHTHTSPAHTHTLAAHTHTYTTSVVSTTDNKSIAGAGIWQSHSHTGTSGALSGGTTNTTAVTYAAMSNDPPYYTVIYIKSAGGTIPDDLIAYYNSATPPTNWYFCNGDNDTPDLRNKYLKGAGTGANSGGTGGTTTNSHDISHTHTTNTHTHAAANSNAGSGTQASDDPGIGNTFTDVNHVHSVSLNAGTQTISANADTLVCAETVEPAYYKLLPIQKKAGGTQSIGLIGLWLGSTESIPTGWVLCDGENGTADLQDKYIKCANTTGEIGDTGGANTHTHAADGHSHTGAASHTHTGTVSAHNGTDPRNSAAQNFPATENTDGNHTVTSNGSTANYASANTTANSSSNEPEYRTAVYIELQSITSEGGSFLYSLL